MAFIRDHRERRDEDVRDLALHSHDPRIDMPWALDQIAGWRMAKTKLPQWATCEGIVYPPHLALEQCSSQITAEYKARLLQWLINGPSGAGGSAGNDKAPDVLVDLTGGFGVDCSYMARVFDSAVYVERQEGLCEIAEHNFAALGLADRIRVVHDDAERYLAQMKPVSAVFIDPARRDAHGARTYAIADCTPDVLTMQGELLRKAAFVVVKLSPMLDWRKAVEDFGGTVREVHIVAAGNECKELLLVLSQVRQTGERLQIVCVNDDQRFAYVAQGGGAGGCGYAVDNVDGNAVDNNAVDGNTVDNNAESLAVENERQKEADSAWQFLYEPNAALMKAGCFALIERRFGVRQIAPNSHLFVTEEPVADFPGRRFRIVSTMTMSKRALKVGLAGLKQANITVRNFPLAVSQLRKRLKLRDGGDAYLFATTDSSGAHIIIRAEKAG